MIDLTYYYIESEMSEKYLQKIASVLPEDMKGIATFSTRVILHKEDILDAHKNGVKRFPCLLKLEKDSMKKNVKPAKSYHYYDDIVSTAESVRDKIVGLKTNITLDEQ